jgi:RNA polymerase sigma-70 factor (ECF subfamily)
VPRPGPPPPDAAELERVRARDPEALAAFFERYFDRVYGTCYRLLGDRTLAEDMTQDVFLKVHRAAHQLDPTRDPGPWLTTIAHNACRDLWRSNAWKLTRRSASLDGDSPVAATLPHPADDPERDHLTRERERLVQEALLALPEPLRVAIVLHDYQGMGHEEIAAATGIHHAAARKRYSRALAALGRLLEESLR